MYKNMQKLGIETFQDMTVKN